MYWSPLCDLDVWQYIDVGHEFGKWSLGGGTGLHRSCPPSIETGYGEIWSPPMPLNPYMVPDGL